MGNIIKSKNDIIAAEKLYDERYAVLTDLLETFMSKIYHETSTINSDIIEEVYGVGSEYFVKYDLKSYYKKGNKSYPRFAFKLKSEKLKPGIFKNIDFDKADMFFMVEIDYKLYCGLTFRTKNKDDIWDNFNLKDYVEGCANTCWVENGWKYVKCNSTDISFKEYTNEQYGMLNLLENNSLKFDDSKIKEISEDIKGEFYRIEKEYFVN